MEYFLLMQRLDAKADLGKNLPNFVLTQEHAVLIFDQFWQISFALILKYHDDELALSSEDFDTSDQILVREFFG